jgi:drug/metabolite transporter (DMT)-like permease
VAKGGAALTSRDLGALILLGVLWGASFLFIRVAVPVFGPFVLGTLAGLGIVLLSVALVTGIVPRNSKPA